MNESKNKVCLAFTLVYLSMVLAALLFAVVNLTKTAFAGFYLVALTVPWSFAFTAILDKLGIQDSVPILLKFLIQILFAVINASLIYFICRSARNTQRSP